MHVLTIQYCTGSTIRKPLEQMNTERGKIYHEQKHETVNANVSKEASLHENEGIIEKSSTQVQINNIREISHVL